jgi:hypothetical protein
MSPENRVLVAQLIGLLAIIAARFGIDISVEQQADILTGLSTFGLLFTAVLAKSKASGDVNNRQGGFARVSALAMLACAAVIALAACTVQPPQTPQTPRQSLLAAYATAESVADTVTIAKQGGYITDAQRDAYVAQLRQVRDLLDASRTLLVNEPAASSVNASEATKNLQAAQTILLALQNTLPKEKTP